MDWKIDGYKSAGHAARAAERRGEVGLTGSGQECGPMCVIPYSGCRGWVYRTWDGRYLIPGGVVSEEIWVEVMTE